MYKINNTLQQKSNLLSPFYDLVPASRHTEKGIISQPSSGKRSQISVLTELCLTRKSETSTQFVKINYFLSGY